jgi:hypothetical protein
LPRLRPVRDVDADTWATTPRLRLSSRRRPAFSAWKFEAGEELLERALEERRKHEDEPTRSPYFNTCALVVA